MSKNVRWTLVTGGARRLGAVIVESLAAQGHNVIIHYNKSSQDAHDLAERCRQQGVLTACVQGDFATPESMTDFISQIQQHYPLIDTLINNVGNYAVKSLLATSAQEWHELWQVNVHAPFALIKALIPSIKQFQGAIINLGIAGLNHVRADTFSTAYTCSKLTLWSMTKSLAKELAAARVRVNMVSPGYLENAVDLPADCASLPMGRAATLAEVVCVIMYLLKPESAYITGQNIEIAGGVRL